MLVVLVLTMTRRFVRMAAAYDETIRIDVVGKYWHVRLRLAQQAS